jgi:hypothetical protein
MKITVSKTKKSINEIEKNSWQYKKTYNLRHDSKDKLNNIFGSQTRVVKEIELSIADPNFDAYDIRHSGRKVNEFYEGMLPQL